MSEFLFYVFLFVWFYGWFKTLFDVIGSINTVERLGDGRDVDEAVKLRKSFAMVAAVMFFLWIPYQIQTAKIGRGE